MAIGNGIIVSSEPRGVFMEGIISGTPKPGTCMQISAGVEMIGGRFTWVAYNPDLDGDRRLVCVLLEDRLQGGLATTAYTSGSQGYLYCPAAGEILNMLLADVGGTGDDFAIGDQLMIDDSTGLLIDVTGSMESEPFTCVETVTDPTADHLTACMYTGH